MKSFFAIGALASLFLGSVIPAVSAAQAANEAITVEALKIFPEECKLIRQAALPFNWVDGKMVVALQVNDHPLHFIVDTGAVFSAIDHDVAKGIGLRRGPLGQSYTLTDTGGGEITSISRIDDIKFGSLKTGGLTLLSVALPKGEDGILAPDLLRNFDVEIDPAQQVINLFKPHSCSDHVVYWTNDFAKLPLARTDEDQIKIPVSIDGVPTQAVLDTGLAHTLIGTDATKAALRPTVVFGPVHHMVAENGGDLSGSEVKLDSFLIGKLNLVGAVVLANSHAPGWQFHYSTPDMTMSVLENLAYQTGQLFIYVPPGPGASAPADSSRVLVGTDILQNLHVLIDYQTWQIYVSKR
jgi:predicted aspartyl protease